MIPDYQSMMLPLLKFLSDKKEHTNSELLTAIADEFKLTEEEKKEQTTSGDTYLNNRVGWANTYLKKAKLLESPKRGFTKITDRGLEVLSKNLQKIDNKFLEQFDEYKEFRTPKNTSLTSAVVAVIEDAMSKKETSDELLEQGFLSNKENLKEDLLSKLREGSPTFFEKVVIQLLEKMGYGKGEHMGKTGDGGVDGIIYQDKLKLEKIYLQAKRFAENNTISASMLRDFIGTLEYKGINKGVFITTSKFPKDSTNTVLSGKSQKSIILVDGNMLVDLMFEYNLGVYVEKSFEIKKIDQDFFEE